MNTKRKLWRHSLAPLGVVALTIAAVVVSSAAAGTVRGTPKADTMRGTASADKLYGNGGNDKLYGLAGNDYLNGGPGNDVVSGGPGADTLVCGPGRDTAIADGSDRIAADCESVQGVPKQALSVANVSQPEGNAGSQPATFTVTLAKASPLRVSVAYATADGTATAGTDYTATSGTIVFAPGQTSRTVAVAVVGDTTYEADETFTLTLSNPVNATLGTATATGTITNDDAAKAAPGHYHGSITTGGFVDFDVSADGLIVTGLTMIPYMTCDNSAGSGTYQFRFTDPAPIQPDLTFTANGSGTGVTVSFEGKFNGGINLASGTLHIHLGYDEGGTHYECDTGDAKWAAVLK